MSVIVPAFLFLILINRTGLLREVTNWDSAPYHLTVFLLPAVFGLTAEGLVQAFIRHCGRSQAALCVVRNLGAGLLGLALVSVGFLGTSWFDNWLGEVVFLTVLVVIGASVFGLGSILNFRGTTRDPELGLTFRAYTTNAAAVVASGIVGVLFAIAGKAIYEGLWGFHPEAI